jgi:hypothetical protein
MQTRSFRDTNEDEQEGEHLTGLEKLSRFQCDAVLRVFEGLNVPRAGFKPLNIWKESSSFFGPKNSPLRKAFIRFWSNHMRPERVPIKSYAEALLTARVTMSEETERELSKYNEEHHEGMEARDEATTTPQRNENDDASLTSVASSGLSSVHKEFKELNFGESVPSTLPSTVPTSVNEKTPPKASYSFRSTGASPFRSPGIRASPFHSPGFVKPAPASYTSVPTHYGPLADYPHNGSREFPFPVYVEAKTKKIPFMNLIFDIHPLHSIEYDKQEHKGWSVRTSVQLPDIKKVEMFIPKMLPPCFSQYKRSSIMYKEPAINHFAGQIDNYEKTSKLQDKGTVNSLRIAKLAIESDVNNEDMAYQYFLILFPLEMGPIDNRILSGHSDILNVDRAPMLTSATENLYKKDLYGAILTWRIALEDQSRQLVGLEDEDNPADFFA